MPIPTDQEIMRELEAAANAGSDPKKEAAVKQLDANPVHAFMANLPSTVPYTLIDGALSFADDIHGGKGTSALYFAARKAVLSFRDGYLSDQTHAPIELALARFAVPFIGYARFLGYLQSAATRGQLHVDGGGDIPSLRFADVHSLGSFTEALFVDALRAIPGGTRAYASYIGGGLSEAALHSLFARSTPYSELLSVGAQVLKEGNRATRTAASMGGTSTDDLTRSVDLQPGDTIPDHWKTNGPPPAGHPMHGAVRATPGTASDEPAMV